MTAATDFRAEAARRILVKDGAYGTMIQAERLAADAYCEGLDLMKDQKGNNDLLNLANPGLVRKICEILDTERTDGPTDGYASLITFVQDRPGHDHRYAVDPTRIESELGWRPKTSFEEGLRRTALWYAERFAPTPNVSNPNLESS